jgi:hypothetical protein
MCRTPDESEELTRIMPWPFSKAQIADHGATLAWSRRLGAVGQLLDDGGLELRDLAISLPADDTWITGVVWWSQREQTGWSLVTLRVADGTLIPLGPSNLSARSPSAYLAGQSWRARLGAVGLLMDRTNRVLHHPTILELNEGFVVTAQRIKPATEPERGLVSLAFTTDELVAAHRDTMTHGVRQ